MTASPITSLLPPFATGAVRTSAGGGATDALGLFSLLLAGIQAVPAEAASSAQPGNKAASALPLGVTLEGSILPVSVASSEQIAGV
jgi:hypothetical protein